MNQGVAIISVCISIVIFSLFARTTLSDEPETDDYEKRYQGYALLRLADLRDTNQTDVLLGLREKYEDKDEISKLLIFDDIIFPRRQPIRMLTSSDLRPVIEEHLKEKNITYEVMKEYINWYMSAMRDLNSRQRRRYYNFVGSRNSYMAPNHYMNYSEIQKTLTNWTESGPNSHLLKTFSIGKTYEGRDTLGIVINQDRTDLPAIWIDAGIDSSVWMSTASALYVAFKIANGKDELSQKLRSKYRWYFLPVVNPDGYDYSHETDRFWRKTRRLFDRGDRTCAGVDMNKNFPNYWGSSGSTDDPCSTRYRGPEAFSEVESRNLKEALEGLIAAEGSLHAYISLQSYGQLILSPWAGKPMFKPADYDYLFAVGKQGLLASERVTEIQEKFRFGTPPDLRYRVSGAVIDWVKDVLKVNWTYAIDVMPTSESMRFPIGHVVPANVIYASGEQIYDIIEAMVEHMRPDLEIDLLELYQGIRSTGPGKADAVGLREEL
jgi:hypothetical protein